MLRNQFAAYELLPLVTRRQEGQYRTLQTPA